jgi:hypothetical protein
MLIISVAKLATIFKSQACGEKKFTFLDIEGHNSLNK